MKKFTSWTSIVLLLASFAIMGQTCETKSPQEEAWETSAHADSTAEAFVHWDEDDPAVIPTSCAKCHSPEGFQDFIGVDGTAAGTVDNEVTAGTGENNIGCTVCHDDSNAVRNITSVTFPSGVELTGLGDEAICMTCHQGRQAKTTVDAAITEAGVADDDTVSEDLSFLNIHYYAAGATLYGSDVSGGYEYDGETYAGQFTHTTNYSTCVECHSPHSLQVTADNCFTCHAGETDVKDIKMSSTDYDGDGDSSEGMYYEIMGLQTKLFAAIQNYGTNTAGTAIVYDAVTYPYYFIDTNENGIADADELAFSNQYNAWTPRLLKAAYNYQTSLKDPGGHVHNGEYIAQLLDTSIDDLEMVSEPSTTSNNAL